MTKNKKMMISALPFVALVVLLAVFCGIVSSKGYRLDMYIKIVFNEGIVLSIVATGAIFIYTLVRFDIIFYVRMRNGLAQMIINVEAQKDEPGSYQILNRAIFYVSRLISSQKERDFVKSNYNDIKTVYSIWVCMNMPENSMCHIYLTKEDLLGKHNWKGNLNLVNIVMIGLTNALPESHNEYGLHRLLCAMFSNELSQQQKMKIMEQEYHIPMEESFKEEVSIMCNLSQGIKEAGIAEGREARIVEGKQREIEKVVLNMHKKGYSLEQIMDATELEEIELKSMIKKLK